MVTKFPRINLLYGKSYRLQGDLSRGGMGYERIDCLIDCSFVTSTGAQLPTHNSWHSDLPRPTCARQRATSAGIATRDAVRIPNESANPIAPILKARSCASAGSCPARKYAFTYESPPQIPSILMRQKTRPGARASGKYPNADSEERINRRSPWITEGIGIARVGRAGRPSDREERERNTVLWYTSCQSG